jgi:hypothetical protein
LRCKFKLDESSHDLPNAFFGHVTAVARELARRK